MTFGSDKTAMTASMLITLLVASLTPASLSSGFTLSVTCCTCHSQLSSQLKGRKWNPETDWGQSVRFATVNCIPLILESVVSLQDLTVELNCSRADWADTAVEEETFQNAPETVSRHQRWPWRQHEKQHNSLSGLAWTEWSHRGGWITDNFMEVRTKFEEALWQHQRKKEKKKEILVCESSKWRGCLGNMIGEMTFQCSRWKKMCSV